MGAIDYNGQGDWSGEAIQQRYARYCKDLKVDHRLDLTPEILIQGDKKWIYPVITKVIAGIEKGDPACKLIGIELIEQDQKFPFGKILKSNTARALRRTPLNAQEQERIRKRLVSMLVAGNVPHEYKEYAKLLKKIGLESYRADLETQINRSNLYVSRYFNYLI
jgi:hypothetical protein